MARPTRTMILAVTVAVLPLAANFAVAGEHFGKRNCPPYCHPTFGYTPPTWRPWSALCTAPAGPALPAEAPAPIPAEKEPESVPAPKPEEPKAKDGAGESKSSAKKGGSDVIPAAASPRRSRAAAPQLPNRSPYAPSLPSADEAGSAPASKQK